MTGNNKLYILVRSDMSPEQQAVQGGHAVAQFLMDNKDHGWKNGTLVYLQVKNDFSFKMWKLIAEMDSSINERSVCFGIFYDRDLIEDIDENTLQTMATAMYLYGPGVERLLQDLSLMRFK